MTDPGVLVQDGVVEGVGLLLEIVELDYLLGEKCVVCGLWQDETKEADNKVMLNVHETIMLCAMRVIHVP